MTIDHFYESIYTCKFDKFFFANLEKKGLQVFLTSLTTRNPGVCQILAFRLHQIAS